MSIFKKTDERISILLPLAFVLPVLSEGWLHSESDPYALAIVRGLVASVFFNTTHVGLTIATYQALPQAGTWSKQRFPNLNLSSTVIGALITAIVFLIYLSAFRILNISGLAGPQWGSLVFTAHSFMLQWHALGQSKGLLMLYNLKMEKHRDLNLRQIGNLKRMGHVERMALGVFLPLSLAYQLIGIEVFQFAKSLQTPILAACYLAMTVAFGATALAPQGLRRNKFWFGLRLLLWPIAITNIAAGLALAAIHGLEYLFVFRLMSQSSDLSVHHKRNLRHWATTSCGLAFVLACMLPSGFGYIAGVWTHANVRIFQIAESLVSAFAVVHCLWDRLFFRLSTNLGRRLIQPLLVGEHASQ